MYSTVDYSLDVVGLSNTWGENVLVLVTVRSVMFAHTLENTKHLGGDIQRCTNQIHPIIVSIEGLTSGGRTYPVLGYGIYAVRKGIFCFFEKLDGKHEKLQNVQYHYVRSVRSHCSKAELIILRACQYVVPLLLCRRT